MESEQSKICYEECEVLWRWFQKQAYEMNVCVSDYQLSLFKKYYNSLTERNKVMNLTAITDLSDVLSRHFLDSLSVNLVHAFEKNERILDLGSGAGFPGIPLKIVFPDTEFCLVDSLQKRVGFLSEVIENCELEKIKAVHGRAEDLAREQKYREKYDVCVSRAVAPLPVLCEYCLPFVRDKGFFISYKAEKAREEIKESERALSLLNAHIIEIKEFCLPETDMKRVLIVIQKNGICDIKYPRKSGLPAKKPL